MAVQALYQCEITGAEITSLLEDDVVIPEEGSLPKYAKTLLSTIEDHLGQIDNLISKASENWSVSRMPIVDRAILRIAVCEMLWIDSVPVSVGINEAVELAKAFGGEDDSARFVNGVLGRISRMERADIEAAVQAQDESMAENEVDGAILADAESAQADQVQVAQMQGDSVEAFQLEDVQDEVKADEIGSSQDVLAGE